MTIDNQLGRTSFPFRHSTMVEGAPIEGHGFEARPVANPLRRQILTVTVGGTASTGAYVLNFYGPSGALIHSVTFTRAAEDNDGISAGLAAAILAADELKSHTREADNSSPPAVAVRFKHAGRSYSITGTAPGSGTLSIAETLAPEGVGLPVGRFVVGATLEGQAAAALPGASAAAADFLGAIARPGAAARGFNPASGETIAAEAGRMVAPVYRGILALRNAGPVAAAANGVVYVVRNVAGGDELGEARATADGSNTVALAVTQARWLTAVQPGELGPVLINL